MSTGAKLALAILFALALVGCAKKPEAQYFGSYNGKMQFAKETRDKIKQSGPQAAQALAELEAVKLSLDLKEDQTFSLDMVGSGMNEKRTGKWTLAEGKITLNPETGIDKTPSTLTPSADGKTLVSIEAKDGKSNITFTRA
jgi:hypothetical protein